MSKLLANEIANYGDNAPIDLKEGLNIPAGKPIQAAGTSGTSGEVLTSTGTSITWTSPFSGDYNTLTNKPTIPASQVNSDWNASSGVAVILNKPTVPPLTSLTVNSVGTANLSFNAANGEFTYTPPDLSNYDTAFGWGDHASAGYLTSLGDAAGVTTAKITEWDTAYGWGNHASAGYLTSYSETQTLDNVLALGATTTRDITTTGKLYYSNNFATTGDLPSATTYHGMFAHVHAEGHGYMAHGGAWLQLLDEGSNIDELGNVDLSIAPTDGYVLKWEASSSSWKAFPDLVGTSNAGITLQDLSVQTSAAGSTSLSYSNTTGVFTYTPPDLSGYLTSETDPVFTASAASGILSSNISNWDTAYGWGDHASAGYLTSANTTFTGLTDTPSSFTAKSLIATNSAGNALVSSPLLFEYGNKFGIGTNSPDSILHLKQTTDAVYMTFDSSSNVPYWVGIPGTNPGFWIERGDNNNSLFTADSSDYVSLYGAGTKRIETTATGVTVTGTLVSDGLTAGGLTYPTTNGTSGDVLTSDGAGNVTWQTPTGGGGGANVTISDTIPAGSPSAGDLWWESDSGRLKVYYQDTDSSQWVDASPPLSQTDYLKIRDLKSVVAASSDFADFQTRIAAL